MTGLPDDRLPAFACLFPLASASIAPLETELEAGRALSTIVEPATAEVWDGACVAMKADDELVELAATDSDCESEDTLEEMTEDGAADAGVSVDAVGAAVTVTTTVLKMTEVEVVTVIAVDSGGVTESVWGADVEAREVDSGIELDVGATDVTGAGDVAAALDVITALDTGATLDVTGGLDAALVVSTDEVVAGGEFTAEEDVEFAATGELGPR